jgi:putative spermidine/putrescine transport system substrate-binding protein
MFVVTKVLRMFLTCIIAVSAVTVSDGVLAKEKLRILAWPGYADAEVVAEFERRLGVAVEVSYVNSDDELWDRIKRNNGARYDVFAVNTAELQRYIDKGLTAPIDIAHIPNHAHQLPRFQNLAAIPGVVRKGKVYAVPYTYSEMGLIYNRKTVKNIPDSMSAMWDPAYRGRVLAYNTSSHNFSVAALLMGVKNPFRLSKPELRQAARKLVDLRRNVLTFYDSPEEAVKLFLENDIALVFANYGTQQVQALRQAGADIGYIIPREGALAWLDCWVVTRGAKDKALAEQWINFTLEKKVSDRLTQQHGLANTVTPFPNSDKDARIIWLEPLEDYAKRKLLWDRITSGDSSERF